MIYKVYEKMPVALQNLMCTVYGYKEGWLRFNSHFTSTLNDFIKSDMADEHTISIKKLDGLSKSLLAAKSSHFYKCLDTITTDEIKNNPLEVLERMPILTKDDLRQFDLDINKTLFKTKAFSTSGTSGKALKLIKDKASISAQWAIWFRHRARFGISPNGVSVNFSGKPLVPLSQKKGPYWRLNKAQNQYLVSMQHINENTIIEIVTFLNSIRPQFFSGYPSIISEVSRLALLKGLELSEGSIPKVVFTGAEKLLSDQEQNIKSWLGKKTTLTDQYGLTEGNCNFSQCEHGNYHEDYEFCHIEILNGEKLDDGSIRGNLVGSAFYNNAMPLIRYDTGDIARMAPRDFECECGRKSRVIMEVDGRVDDFVLLPDNRRIMRFDYLFKNTYEVIEAQVIQRELSSLDILAVLAPGANSIDFEKKVTAHFNEYIHEDLELKFVYTNKIERSNTGKFKAVINRLNKQ